MLLDRGTDLMDRDKVFAVCSSMWNAFGDKLPPIVAQWVDGVINFDPAVNVIAEATWLKERETCITSSDIGAILGLSDYRGPYGVFQAKMGQLDKVEQNKHMYFGHRLEGWIADEYRLRTGDKLVDPGRYTLQRHPKHKFIGATVDRIIVGSDEDGHGVLECKTAGGYDDWPDGPPPNYVAQIQTAMYVTGLKWGAIAVFFLAQKDFKVYRIAADPKFAKVTLLPNAREFWSWVEAKHFPQEKIDGLSDTTDSIKQVWDAINASKTVDGDARMQDLTQQYHDGVQEEKDGEYNKRWAANQILEFMGEAKFLTLPDGRRWSRSVVAAKTIGPYERKGYTKMNPPRKKKTAVVAA